MPKLVEHEFPNKPGKKNIYGSRTDAYKERKKDLHLRRTFGITLDEYNVMLAEQGGVCAICKCEPKTYKNLSVDHDWQLEGKDSVRALLCHTCNSELGILEKDLDKNESRLLKYREKYIHRREGAK